MSVDSLGEFRLNKEDVVDRTLKVTPQDTDTQLVCADVVRAESLKSIVIDEAVLRHMLEAGVDRLAYHLEANSGGAIGSSSMLGVLECNHKLVAPVLSELDGVLRILEVTKLDALQTRVQPDDVVVALTVDANALNSGSTAVLGAREPEVRNLDLQHSCNEVKCIHRVFILLVESAMKVLSAELGVGLVSITTAINLWEAVVCATALTLWLIAPVVRRGLVWDSSNVMLVVSASLNTR
jgi:hypothetical protein